MSLMYLSLFPPSTSIKTHIDDATGTQTVLAFANDTEAYAIYANLFSSVVAALGAENMAAAPNGVNIFGVNVDLSDEQTFGFTDGRYDHSAQFHGTMLGGAGAYWEEVVNLIV